MGISLFTLVEQGMAYLLGIIGFSLLFCTQNWVQVLEAVCNWKKQTLEVFALLCSFIYIPFGVGIILIHSEWTWSSSVIVTILGWIILLKSAVFLFFPEKVKWMKLLMNKSEKFLNWFFKVLGVLYIGLGFCILCPYWF